MYCINCTIFNVIHTLRQNKRIRPSSGSRSKKPGSEYLPGFSWEAPAKRWSVYNDQPPAFIKDSLMLCRQQGGLRNRNHLYCILRYML